jgi:hypothetical protein
LHGHSQPSNPVAWFDLCHVFGVVGDGGSKRQSISATTDLWGGGMILNCYVPFPRCPAWDSSIDLIESLGVASDGGLIGGCGGGEGS